MGVAKVTLNGTTLIDTTGKTVTSSSMLSGITALDKKGDNVTGNISSKSSTDLTVSGATVTAPAGYYANAASKAVATTTHPNPTASIASSTGVVTASHTQGTGYVTGGTTTGTLNLTTKAAATYNTSTADQTIASNRWLTGAQTIKSVTTSNLTAANIKSGVTVKVGDANNASRITQVTGTYSDAPTYTATISGTGNSTYCYVQLNNTKYYTAGDTFTFKAGDTLTCHVGNGWGNVPMKVRVNKEEVSTGAGNYTYTLPNGNISIALDYYEHNMSSSLSYTYIDISYGNTCYLKIDNDGSGRYSIYVQTSSKTYSLSSTKLSDSFAFTPGENLSCYAQQTWYNYGEITLNNIVLSKTTSGGGAAVYNYQLPQTDVSIHFKAVSGRISIYTDFNEYQATKPFGELQYNTSWAYPYQFYYNNEITKVNFPNCGVVGEHAFESCSKLTTAIFPVCSRIETGAFRQCSKLSEISFPTATSVFQFAFQSCPSLTSVFFPEAVMIEQYAFAACSNLTTISFPKCEYISIAVFNQCSKLVSAIFPECTFIDQAAFGGCSSLTTVSFPKCTNGGTDTFWGCRELVNVYMPLISQIGFNTFSNCHKLSVVSFSLVSSIGNGAFSNCYNLISLYLTSVSSVPTLGTYVFYSTPIGGYSTSAGRYGSVFVPASLYSTFVSATNWAAISSRIVSV